MCKGLSLRYDMLLLIFFEVGSKYEPIVHHLVHVYMCPFKLPIITSLVSWIPVASEPWPSSFTHVY